MTNGTSPTRIRYGVLGFACSLAAITYLDRLCIGSAAPYLKDALGLQNVSELRWVFTAFSLAYAIFEVPTGWLGDVFGPRVTLIRIVLWWSFFTALTGFAGVQVWNQVDSAIVGGLSSVTWWEWASTVPAGITLLIIVRFLFGIGEAGAFPNITRALHNWFPITERGMAQGWVWMSGRLMGGLTPLIWMGLVIWPEYFWKPWPTVAWRYAFVLFGVIGILWCIAFAVWFRNRPEEKPGVNDAERALIHAGTRGATEQAHANVPWLQLLKSWNLWAICIMYFLMSYPWYFFVNYLPSYLEEIHSVSRSSALGSLYKGGPLIFGAVGCLLGGWLTDRYIRRTGDRKWGRRIFGMIGHGLCVPMYLFCIVAPTDWSFALALAMAGFFNDLAMGSAWATCQDIGRRHSAIVAGCMNTIGNLGGAVSSYMIGWLIAISISAYLAANGLADADFAKLSQDSKNAAQLPGYTWNFITFAAMYAGAVLLWLFVDATKPVLAEDAQTEVAT